MQRKRLWAAVLYPESLPDNWLDILTETGLQIAISPIHDSDFSANGEVKKAHYHVILRYPGPTSYNIVNDLIVDNLHGVSPKFISDLRGAYRYLTHKDDPNKAQYKDSDIRLLNGFSAEDLLSSTDITKLKAQVFDFIVDNEIVEYAVLVDTLRNSEEFELFHVATSNTMLFKYYLDSRRNMLKV